MSKAELREIWKSFFLKIKLIYFCVLFIYRKLSSNRWKNSEDHQRKAFLFCYDISWFIIKELKKAQKWNYVFYSPYQCCHSLIHNTSFRNSTTFSFFFKVFSSVLLLPCHQNSFLNNLLSSYKILFQIEAQQFEIWNLKKIPDFDKNKFKGWLLWSLPRLIIQRGF